MTTTNNNPSLMSRSIKIKFNHSLKVFLGFSLFYTIFFSPILFSAKLLAPGDGITYYLPAFYSTKTLWTNLIFSGYPVAADPQNMTWYPPAMVLSLIPHSWNVFIVLAYVLAGSFSYCYSYTVTKSELAATVTGLTYSMSGFMIAHLSHACIVHASAWIPLIVCALERLRHHIEIWWVAIGIVAVACCCLGGHPQISTYGIGVALFYVLFLGIVAPIGRRKYYCWGMGVIIMGVALCAIQLLPTIELSRLSVRAEMSLESFLSYSLPTWQIPQLIFPHFFGGTHLPYPYNSYPYWGEWNLAEISGYVGILPIILGLIGLISYPNRSVARFWFWLGLIALLATFGGRFPFAKILYYVPVYNIFRAPGRHFIEVALSVSVLAGFGVTCLERELVSSKLISKVTIFSSILMMLSLVIMLILYNPFLGKARKFGITKLILLPWKNPAVGIPLLIFGIGLITLIFTYKHLKIRWCALLLIVVIIIDLSSFGWFFDWQISAPNVDQLNPSIFVNKYRTLLQINKQRFLNIEGSGYYNSNFNKLNNLFPNLTRLWNFPNAGGYSPLILARVNRVMHMGQNGAISFVPTKQSEHQLDLMSVRYLLISRTGMSQNQLQGASVPLRQIELSTKWKKVERLDDNSTIYENQHVLPRSWLVPETIVLKPDEVLTAIHTSQLPDGRTYDPQIMALVEDSEARFQSSSIKPSDSVKLLKLEETQVELQTQSSIPAFLVLSDVFYPGWIATVDGRTTQIFQTNYIQRGIKIPSGDHIVRFEFHPLSFKLGSSITIILCFGSPYWLIRSIRASR